MLFFPRHNPFISDITCRSRAVLMNSERAHVHVQLTATSYLISSTCIASFITLPMGVCVESSASLKLGDESRSRQSLQITNIRADGL